MILRGEAVYEDRGQDSLWDRISLFAVRVPVRFAQFAKHTLPAACLPAARARAGSTLNISSTWGSFIAPPALKFLRYEADGPERSGNRGWASAAVV